MKLRGKLILALGLAGTVLMVFFTYVAWQTAANQGQKQRRSDLRAMARAYLGHKGAAASERAIERYLNRNNFYFLVGANGEVATTSARRSDVSGVIRTLLARIRAHPGDHMPFVRRGHEYAWLGVRSPHGAGRVYFVSRAHEPTTRSYLKAMAPPMLAAAFMVLWAIFWGGTYLARLYSKLDDQRKELRFLALNDSLTGLPNRALFQDRLSQTLERAKRYHQAFALAIVDLNRFKEINDLLGHEFGDRVLREIGERLSGVLRKSDTVARLGGDEFALLMPGTDLVQAELSLVRLVESFREPVIIDGQRLQITGSMGLALFPAHGEDSNSLARAADLAMYESKQLKSPYVVYDSQRHDGRNNLVLLQKLIRAIEEEAFELYYQPQVCVNTGAVTAMEALLRWRGDDGNFVCPEEFVSLAEQTGHIRQITRWVFARALRDHQYFQQRGHQVRMAINLSVCDLADDSLFNYLRGLLQMHEIDPCGVILEITESAMASNPRRVGDNLDRLVKELELALSIDDFGTGYSSLTNLQQMTVTELKIDRSFVRRLKRNEPDYQIVKSIVHLAHDLGLRVVAEGVESGGVLDELKGLGCDNAQGYYISKPMAREDMLAWLRGYGPPAIPVAGQGIATGKVRTLQ